MTVFHEELTAEHAEKIVRGVSLEMRTFLFQSPLYKAALEWRRLKLLAEVRSGQVKVKQDSVEQELSAALWHLPTRSDAHAITGPACIFWEFNV